MRSLQAAIWAVFCCLSSGCSVLDMNKAPPSDWPALVVDVQRAGFWRVQEICRNPSPILTPYMGCPIVRFDLGRCQIWLVISDPDTEAAVEAHERLHCKGYDHVGSNQLADDHARYKGTNNLRVER